MKQKTDSSETPAMTVSRRAALRRVVATGLALGSLPALAGESAAQPAAAEPEFVPENDYPYFGYEPDSP
jgi:hypothetical protein